MKTITMLATFAVTLALAIAGWRLGSAGGSMLASTSLGSASLTSVGGLLGVSCALAVATYVMAPIMVWLSFSMPSDIHYRRFDASAHPFAPGAREYVAAKDATLRGLGFERVEHVAAAHGAVVVHVILFWNPHAATVAQIYCTNAMNAVVLRTRFESGKERVSHSGEAITTIGTAPWELNERFPNVEPVRLSAAHQALIADDERDGERVARPDPPPVSDALAYMHDYENRQRAWREQIGQRRTDADGNIHLTLSSAFRTTWIQIPWHQKRLREAARVHAEALLVKLGV